MTTIHDKNRNATFYFAKNGMLNPVCRIVKQCKQKEANYIKNAHKMYITKEIEIVR